MAAAAAARDAARERAPLLRSVLFVPGSSEKLINKAKGLGADAVILCMEDAVKLEEKDMARELVCSVLAEEAETPGGWGKTRVAVRINDPGTDWGQNDIRALIDYTPDAVVVPKVESDVDLEAVYAGGISDDIPCWAMVETPRGVLSCAEWAENSPAPLEALVVGAQDLTTALHAEFTGSRDPLRTSMQHVLLAARACGLLALDAVSSLVDVSSVESRQAFLDECKQAREFGFDGKTLIHPSQIEPCHTIFSPTPEQVDRARRIVEAFRAAEGSVCVVDNAIVEHLHYYQAKAILALHERITEE